MINEIGCERLSLFISLKDTSILPCEQIFMGAKYFLGILYIMNEQYDKAENILKELVDLEDAIVSSLEKIMLKAVYYYASAMDKLKDHKKSMYYINLLFDIQIAEAIDMSFNKRCDILINHYGITEDDYVDNDDAYYLPFMKKFREAQRDNVINQIRNKEIFM